MGAIAGVAWGIVTRQELLGEGISEEEIRVRLQRGALLEEYPGTYRVGHRAPSAEATYMAAVKAAGDGSLLAGRAGAYHWRLIKGASPPPRSSLSLKGMYAGSSRTGHGASRASTPLSTAGSRSRRWLARSSTWLRSSTSASSRAPATRPV